MSQNFHPNRQDFNQYMVPVFAPAQFIPVRGEGSRLWDQAGKEYIDFAGGIAVNALGHAHPVAVKALVEQGQKLWHIGNGYTNEPVLNLAKQLVESTFADKVFFCNSGAEANEGAIKIARKFASQQGIQNPKIVVAEKSFHGRTLATLSATGNSKVQEGFYPLIEGFIRVPFGDLEALQEVALQHPDIVAILIEPIQGEGGINTAPQGFSYLEDVRALCNQHNWLMMLDEIQTGNGRTGKYFAYQHTNIVPDVLTTAKGLGNGFPIGAVMTQAKAVGILGPGSHGSTYGGTVLGSRVVYTVIDTIQKENAVENAAKVGTYIVEQLREQLSGLNVEVRGFGMMIGIELPKACAELVAIARDEYQLIINVTAGSVVRLLPPLNMTQEQADDLLSRLVPAIKQFLA